MSDLNAYRAAVDLARVLQEAMKDPDALNQAAANISRLSKQEEDKLNAARATIAQAQSVKDAQDVTDALLKKKASDLSDKEQSVANTGMDLEAKKAAFEKDAADKKQKISDSLQDLQSKKSDFETNKNSILDLHSKLQAREESVSQRENDTAVKESFLKSEEDRIKSYEDQIKAKAQKLKELAEG